MKSQTKKFDTLLISMYGAGISGLMVTFFGLYQVSLLI